MSQCGVCRENPRVDWFTINLSFTETFSLTPGWIFFRRMKVELRQKMMYVWHEQPKQEKTQAAVEQRE